MASYSLLILAAFVAGVLNSVAGGGSFLTFPALVFTGVPSIIANATNTVALTPGTLASVWAYRHDFKKFDNFPFPAMMVVSVVGGFAGAMLLLLTPQRTFDHLIPWLMLAATLIFAFGPILSPVLQKHFHISPALVVCIQFGVAVYGGYFGGAIGIVMLAAWSLLGQVEIHAMNANKNALATTLNGVAMTLFIIARKVWWHQALVMLAAAVAGGYLGARAAKKVDRRHVRMAIIAVSSCITIAFFLRRS
jgi:uncharacterized membrane protein YfcA